MTISHVNGAGLMPVTARMSLAAPALLISVGALLAGSVLLSKLAAGQGAPMLPYLSAVLTGAGGVLALFGALTGQMRGAVRYLPYALGAGVFMALPSAMGYLTVAEVGAGFISLTFAFPVLLTWLISVLLRMERLRLLPVLGVLSGLSGGLILALGKAGVAGAGAPVSATLTASLIPVVVALGNIYRTRLWPRGAEALPLAALTLIAGGFLSLPFALPTALAQGAAFAAALPVAILAALVVAGQMVLQFRLQALAGPVYMSQIGAVAAVMGTLIAVGAMGEGLPGGFVPAALLIAAGAGAFQWARRHG